MDSFYTMLRLQMMLLIFLLAGIIMRKRSVVSKDAIPCFSEFLVRVALPCMVFNSFQSDIAKETVLFASKVLIVSTAVCTYSFVLGLILFRRTDPGHRSVMRYGTLVSNAGFAGLPQVLEAYGSVGLMYASIYLIPLRVFMWSGGISIFLKSNIKSNFKKIFINPAMLAVFAGGLRMLLQIQMPSAADTAIKAIGDCTNPISMIVIGMVVADIPWKRVINRETVYLTILRLIILPVSVLLLFKAMKVDPILIGIAVLLTAMPVGVNTPLLAQKYGSDYEFAAKCVLLSTVSSLITLPIISIFL